MQAMNFNTNTKGFTLIELIAVMVILGVMASVAVKKYNFISDTASDRALQEVIKEHQKWLPQKEVRQVRDMKAR